MPAKKVKPVVRTDPFVALAKDAYDASTDYIDQNQRKVWDMSIRAFHSEHPMGSKYHHPSYKYRSKLYRPKTRSTIRRMEAAATAAFFGAQNLVEVEPANEANPFSVGSAQASQYLLNHRLEKTIPWFQTCIGAMQDASTMGACVSYNHWKYKKDRTGKVICDEPEILLRPVENIRFDPAAEWTDVVNTSPYFVDLIPMYANDVLYMMSITDPKTGQPRWKNYTEAEIQATQTHEYDSTRSARNKDRQDPMDQRDGLKGFDIIWVHRNFIRQNGEEFFYYTLGDQKLLTEPVYLDEAYHHGERPYTMGQVILETHKTHPSGIPEISKDVQKEANEIQNSRMDNVKLVLNKRYFVKRGREVDLQSLVRNAAGSATLMTDVDGDVRVVDTPDVTGSSYAEQDRINLDFDDLVGAFSTGTVQSNRSLNETVGGLNLLRGEAGTMTGYALKTFAETWMVPTLRQLIKLEAEYESDTTLLALAADHAEAYARYGLDPTIDEMLNQELFVTVNVGMTATDPGARLQQLILTTKEFTQIAQNNPGLDLRALADDMYGKIGYRDASRFWPKDSPDPEVVQLQQMVQNLQAELESQMAKVNAENQAKIEMKRLEEESENRRHLSDIELKQDQARVEAELKRMDQETKKLVAQIQGQTQIKVAEIQSQDKSRDRLVNRLGAQEQMQREIENQDLTDELENKVDELADELQEHEQKRAKSREAIMEYLRKSGSEHVQGLVDQVEKLEGRAEADERE